VAEFSSATALGDAQLMVASAIKQVTPGRSVLAVYVSRNGGIGWSEVPAWSDTGFQPRLIHGLPLAQTARSMRAVLRERAKAHDPFILRAATKVFPGRPPASLRR
jgi:hypothetical protein